MRTILAKSYTVAALAIMTVVGMGGAMYYMSRQLVQDQERLRYAYSQLQSVLELELAFDHYALHVLAEPDEAVYAPIDRDEARRKLDTAVAALFVPTAEVLGAGEASGPLDHVPSRERVDEARAALQSFVGTLEAGTAQTSALERERTGQAERFASLMSHWEAEERSEVDHVARHSAALVSSSLRVTLLCAGGTLLIIVVGTLVLIPRFRRSFFDLLQGCDRLSSGHFDQPLPVSGRDEFTVVARAFNSMLARLEKVIASEGIAREQAAILQAQAHTAKLAAIGQLASGVAHEINNPIGVILGFAQSMERRLGEVDALRLPVTSIIRESRRCKELVGDLLTFSRNTKNYRASTGLNEAVTSALTLIRAKSMRSTVEIKVEMASDLSELWADATQLQQVVINLGTNALDAMEDGGVLTIRTLQDREWILLEVSDTGTGIAKEVFDLIYHPFFTTKAPGKGTGLGLSLVHEIVLQLEGKIDVETERGVGTTFSIRLPARSAALADDHVVVPYATSSDGLAGGSNLAS